MMLNIWKTQKKAKPTFNDKTWGQLHLQLNTVFPRILSGLHSYTEENPSKKLKRSVRVIDPGV